MKNIVIHSSILLAGGTALAHDGHGLAGSHWHASDTLGLVAAGLVFALALWRGRK